MVLTTDGKLLPGIVFFSFLHARSKTGIANSAIVMMRKISFIAG
jgi:hypothetical protein